MYVSTCKDSSAGGSMHPSCLTLSRRHSVSVTQFSTPSRSSSILPTLGSRSMACSVASSFFSLTCEYGRFRLLAILALWHAQNELFPSSPAFNQHMDSILDRNTRRVLGSWEWTRDVAPRKVVPHFQLIDNTEIPVHLSWLDHRGNLYLCVLNVSPNSLRWNSYGITDCI